MAYPTVAEVTARAQAYLNDAGGDYWTSTTLLPFVNMAYDEITREFQRNGVGRFRVRTTLDLAVNQTTVARVNVPAVGGDPVGYPADLIEPLELWEKPYGSADTNYTSMQKATNQLPDLTPDATLRYWDWYSDKIMLVGSNAAITVRLDYIGDNATLTTSGTMLVNDSLDAAAFLVAAGAARARGQREMAQDYEQEGRKRISDLISLEVQTMQAAPKRRRPSRNATNRYYF